MFHAIAKDIVLAGDIDSLVRDCERLFLNREHQIFPIVKANVKLTFSGYDFDPREISQIPEVRDYCLKIIESLPVAYMCDSETLKILAMCTAFNVWAVLPGRAPGKRVFAVSPDKGMSARWTESTRNALTLYARRLDLNDQEVQWALDRASGALSALMQNKGVHWRHQD
jgi:hypothetical protein